MHESTQNHSSEMKLKIVNMPTRNEDSIRHTGSDISELKSHGDMNNNDCEKVCCVSAMRLGSLTCYTIPHIPQHIQSATHETQAHIRRDATPCRGHTRVASSSKGSPKRTYTRVSKLGPVPLKFLLLVGTIISLLLGRATSQPLDFNTMSESFSTVREGDMETPSNYSSVEETELSAKEFLGKFGYVEPAEWTSVSPRNFGGDRFNQGVIEGEESLERNKDDSREGSGIEDKEINLVKWSFEDITEWEYRQALIKYQRINGLKATGMLDNDTRSYMGKPRCGVPDRTAKIKINRTIDQIDARTPSTTRITTTTTTEETTTGLADSSREFIKSTTNSSNSTESWGSSDVTTARAILLTSMEPIVIHSITTAQTSNDFDSSGDYDSQPTDSGHANTHDDVDDDDMDGSGHSDANNASTDDKTISRRRRSSHEIESMIHMEAAFEVIRSHLTGNGNIDGERGYGAFGKTDQRGLLGSRGMNFASLDEASISEAELPEETRVASLETIFEALRREKLSQINGTVAEGNTFHGLVSKIRPTPAPPVPNLVKRMVTESRAKRRKRSNVYYFGKTNGWWMAYPERVITWRLVDEWPTKRPLMISNEIWFTVKLAFRMWSEILPRNFREDNHSPMSKVDILLGFGRNEHNRCLVPFVNGQFSREYAHAWPLPQAEVHFNDDQPFVSVSFQPSSDNSLGSVAPISLLKVAIHEIGHTVGLPHKKDKTSVMNPVYIPYLSNAVVELEEVDRRSIQAVYGQCHIEFDAVFDWVRQYIGKDGVLRWKYNTFFFRNTWFWLYENRGGRPRYGDPKYSFDFWRGVIQRPTGSSDPHRKIDGVVHIRDWSIPNGPIYFFTGDTYSEYDSSQDRVKSKDSKGNSYPRLIKDGFPGIPHPIDTVVYKWEESLLYFFKGEYVYKFDWKKNKVVNISPISTTFPGWGGAASLPNNIDAAYYSYTDYAYYFFKGIYYWRLAGEDERKYNKGLEIPENAVSPRDLIAKKWQYLCDVDETEMHMTLPAN